MEYNVLYLLYCIHYGEMYIFLLRWNSGNIYIFLSHFMIESLIKNSILMYIWQGEYLLTYTYFLLDMLVNLIIVLLLFLEFW